MAVHARLFNREKALEATLFIAQQLHAPTMHSVSKMLYLADKLHLQEYGRLICGERYIAMEYGPVPSAIYNMMKVSAGRGSVDPDVDELIMEAFAVVNGRNVHPKRSADTAVLSESEMECIRETIAQFGSKTFGQLTDITHDAAWESTDENQPIALAAMVQTLPNSAELAAYIESH